MKNLAAAYLITIAHAAVQIYVEVNTTYPPFRYSALPRVPPAV